MTESKFMTLLRPAQECVNGWKKLGGRFALEQFGSGLNSFQLLNHIHADYLKIDRSYMADLPQHPDSQKKIAELCQQARELNRQTIAEWVEDATSTRSEDHPSELQSLMSISYAVFCLKN